MAASTQKLSEYNNRASTLYEACLVIAQRGRIINQEMISKKREKEMFEETDLMDPMLEGEQEELPVINEDDDYYAKPVILAQNEFLNDELEFEYEPEKKKK